MVGLVEVFCMKPFFCEENPGPKNHRKPFEDIVSKILPFESEEERRDVGHNKISRSRLLLNVQICCGQKKREISSRTEGSRRNLLNGRLRT